MSGAAANPKTRTVLVQVHGVAGAGKAGVAAQIASELGASGAQVSVIPGRAAWYDEVRQTAEEEAERALAVRMLDGSFSSEAALIDASAAQIMKAEQESEFIVLTEPPAQALMYARGMTETYRDALKKRAADAIDGFSTINVLVPTGAEDTARDLLDSTVETYLEWKDGNAGLVADAAEAERRRVESLMPKRASGPHGKPSVGIAQGVDPARREIGADMAQEQAERAREQGAKREYVNIQVPKKGYGGKDNVINIESNGKPYVKARLPYGVPEIQTAEGPVDVSGFTFLARPENAKTWKNDPNWVSIGMPKENAKGEPWEVNLMKNRGHFEDEAGARVWVSEGEPLKLRVTASQLSEAMEGYRQERFDHAVDKQAQKLVKELGPEKAAKKAADVPENATRFDRAVYARTAQIAQAPSAKRMDAPAAKRAERRAPSVKSDTTRAAAAAKAQAQQAPKRAQAQAR